MTNCLLIINCINTQEFYLNWVTTLVVLWDEIETTKSRIWFWPLAKIEWDTWWGTFISYAIVSSKIWVGVDNWLHLFAYPIVCTFGKRAEGLRRGIEKYHCMSEALCDWNNNIQVGVCSWRMVMRNWAINSFDSLLRNERPSLN